MSTKHTPTITEILARLNKAAEEAVQADVDKETPPQAEVGAEQDAPDPCNDPECYGVTTGGEEKKPEPAETLADLAKEAAAGHREALKKEAQLFGEIFAGAMLGQFKAAADAEMEAPEDAEVGTEQPAPKPCPVLTNDAEEANVVVTNEEAKTAELMDALVQLGCVKLAEIQEEAYTQTLCKLASDEAYDLAMQALQSEQSDDTPSLTEVAGAVQAAADAAANAAGAAQTLTEAVANQNAAVDDEDDEDDDVDLEDDEDEDDADVDPEMVQDAYDQTLQALQGGDEGEQADVDPETVQAAYDQTMQALGQ